MSIHRLLISALLGTLTLTVPLHPANACGPFFFFFFLIEKDGDFLPLPYSTFAYDAA